MKKILSTLIIGCCSLVVQAQVLGVNIDPPISTLHVYENTTTVDTGAGLTIEQDDTGDAILQHLITGSGQRWVMGIDNTDDKFKIASSADLGSNTRLTIQTNGEVGIGTTTPAEKL